MKLEVAIRLGVNIQPNNQLALIADQKTRMSSLGEIDIVINIDNILMRLRALVMRDLESECFGGTTFHVDNKLTADIGRGVMSVHGKFVVTQSNPQPSMPSFLPPVEKFTSPEIPMIMRISTSTTSCYNNRRKPFAPRIMDI